MNNNHFINSKFKKCMKKKSKPEIGTTGYNLIE